MAWRIEFHAAVEKDLKRLGPDAARRVLKFLRERVAPLADARALGEPLHGPELGDFWKYRVGDYRIVAQIQDRLVTVIVVRVGHRRDVYR